MYQCRTVHSFKLGNLCLNYLVAAVLPHWAAYFTVSSLYFFSETKSLFFFISTYCKLLRIHSTSLRVVYSGNSSFEFLGFNWWKNKFKNSRCDKRAMANALEYFTALRKFHVYSNTVNRKPHVGQKISFKL